MSTFSISGNTCTFEALDDGFNDKGGPLEEVTVGIELESATAWGLLFSLRSWNVTQRPIPGGNNVYVDIGGGAGEGQLTIDSLDQHNAILTALSRSVLEAGTLRSKGIATWLITS